ncbi:MAG TPA: hypothetical protein VK980_18395 [Sphingomonas sp.]|nr:hypothetical protein [Sphingomonas sp.]
MADDDLIYLLRRAADERARAEKAIDPAARAAHDGLAQRYDQRIREQSAGRVRSIRT